MSAEAYSERVRALFFEAAHGGDLPAGGGSAAGSPITVHAEEGGAGARIVLTGITDGDTLKTLRYRVFGCPHLVAAAEQSCERFEGGPVEAIRAFSVPELRAELGIPIEKTGRLLLLQDALNALRRDLLRLS